MAKLNNPQGKPTSPRTMTPEERQKLAQSQARARSMARAQAVARAQANARAQARARLAAMADEGEEIAAVEETVLNETSPKTEAPKTEAPKTEAPKTEAPKTETPKTEAPKTEASKTEAQGAEAARVNKASEEKEGELLEYAVRIRDLHKSYGKKTVLKGLNLDVYPGELFGFIGRNGIGKSTTIDCMIGAKRFNSGSITVGGYDIQREALDAKYSYGYVASEPTCYEVMTGYDYLEFVASVYGLTETEFAGNYKYLCNRLQLNLSELSHQIGGYSHGMKQKLCLVASLLHNPNIWILDEPTVGLDIMAQEELKKMMREYANHGRTVFVTSHNIELVSMICDRVAIINDGVVKAIYDLNRDPEKRGQLARIFLETYGG